MAIKTYKVEFYVADTQNNGEGLCVGDMLAQLAQTPYGTKAIGSYNYELRSLQPRGDGAFFRGELAKFRDEDLPHAGIPGGEERPLELADEEGLIGLCHH